MPGVTRVFPPALQTPHGDPRDHQGGEGGLPAGHGEAGVALRGEPAGRPPPLLPQREDHDHPVSSMSAGNDQNAKDPSPAGSG